MDYGVAKFVNFVGILIGWLAIAVGLLPIFNSDEDSLMLALTAGGPLIAAGLILVALCQMANATIQTAEESKTTNDLLRQLIDRPAASAQFVSPVEDAQPKSAKTVVTGPNSVESPSPGTTTATQSSASSRSGLVLVKAYKGHAISKIDGTRRFFVDDQEFEGLLAAEKYITSLTQG